MSRVVALSNRHQKLRDTEECLEVSLVIIALEECLKVSLVVVALVPVDIDVEQIILQR